MILSDFHNNKHRIILYKIIITYKKYQNPSLQKFIKIEKMIKKHKIKIRLFNRKFKLLNKDKI